jgi:hypothetical protein
VLSTLLFIAILVPKALPQCTLRLPQSTLAEKDDGDGLFQLYTEDKSFQQNTLPVTSYFHQPRRVRILRGRGGC